MKYEYQKKVALLDKQKKTGINPESLDKLKASVSHFHTRYIVDMQSVASIVAEINHLRDEKLYPNLVQLVDGMATMWESMRYHHETQSNFVYALRSLEQSLDNSQPPRENKDYYYYADCTIQLWAIVCDWHTQFCRLIDYQKDYVRALGNWLKLDLSPIERPSKDKASSSRVLNLAIHELLVAWNNDLDKLPDEVARSAISNFAAVIQIIMHQQEEEIKMEEKCEATREELKREDRKYQDWCIKNGIFEEKLDCGDPLMIAKEKRESVVISLRQQLAEDEEEWKKISRQMREKSLASLKQCMPELFRAMSEFALACSVLYSNLKSIAENE